jgi:uncharacterized protein (TIGR00268 family)
MTSIHKKFERIRGLFEGKRVLVAFSGGVDSSVLAHVARVYALDVVLLTVDSITFPRTELQAAMSVAEELGIRVEVIQVDELANPDLVKNPVDRCYHNTAEQLRMDIVVDGTNASDMRNDYRPGALALEEAGVISPFREYGITKEDIRSYARETGLSVAERPSMACLSSRFPYGTEITEERVRRVDKVESDVRALFEIECVRARFHDDVVRIEVGREERERLFDVTKLDRLYELARDAGFKYVAFDVAGYRTGAMNEVLESPAPETD